MTAYCLLIVLLGVGGLGILSYAERIQDQVQQVEYLVFLSGVIWLFLSILTLVAYFPGHL